MDAANAIPNKPIVAGSGTTSNEVSSTNTIPLFVAPPLNVWIAYTTRAVSTPAGTVAGRKNCVYAFVGTGVEFGVREISVLLTEFRHSIRTSTPKSSGLLGDMCQPLKVPTVPGVRPGTS